MLDAKRIDRLPRRRQRSEARAGSHARTGAISLLDIS